MNIGWHVVEQEEAEKAATRLGEKVRRTAPTLSKQGLRAQLAEVERQIAEVEAQLDQDPGDDPALYPLRKKLVGLWNKHRALLDQLEGGTHR